MTVHAEVTRIDLEQPNITSNKLDLKLFNSMYDRLLAAKTAAHHSPRNRILVIDDDADMGELLQYSLVTKYNCLVDVATDPFEAMNLMTEHFYNSIVLDWNLPALNGGETLQKAAQAMAYEPFLPFQWDQHEVPVIVISSDTKETCQPKKTKHFSYVGFVSKAQPLRKIVSLLAGYIESNSVPKNLAS